MSTRALMRKYGVGYETVRRALVSALPEPRKKQHTVALPGATAHPGGTL
jgi:hypothetical protein